MKEHLLSTVETSGSTHRGVCWRDPGAAQGSGADVEARAAGSRDAVVRGCGLWSPPSGARTRPGWGRQERAEEGDRGEGKGGDVWHTQ